MASLFVRRPRTEYGILRGVSLWVPTDEQIEKAKRTSAEHGRTYKPALSLRTEVEPLSYRFDGGTMGNISLKYLPITWSLEEDDIAAARDAGLHGVPPNRIITASLRGGPDDEKNLFPRWLKYLQAAGFDLDVDDAGQPTIPGAIGQIFRMQEGDDVFPSSKFNTRTQKWEDKDADGKPYTFSLANLQYLVAHTPDYVQDPDKVRIITVRAKDENEGDAAVTSAAGVGLNLTTQLRDAARASGLVGRNASEFANARAALKFCDDAIGVAPILVSDAVNEAAASGMLVAFLVEQDAIAVDADGTILGRE